MEGKQGQFIHPLANITNILTSVGSVVSLETEGYIHTEAMAGPEARAVVTLKNFKAIVIIIININISSLYLSIFFIVRISFID